MCFFVTHCNHNIPSQFSMQLIHRGHMYSKSVGTGFIQIFLLFQVSAKGQYKKLFKQWLEKGF